MSWEMYIVSIQGTQEALMLAAMATESIIIESFTFYETNQLLLAIH